MPMRNSAADAEQTAVQANRPRTRKDLRFMVFDFGCGNFDRAAAGEIRLPCVGDGVRSLLSNAERGTRRAEWESETSHVASNGAMRTLALRPTPRYTPPVNLRVCEADLHLHNLHDMGHHYVRTLREWRAAFNAHHAELRHLRFDESFIRKWNYYFSYCEAAFAQRNISVVQAVYTRPNNRSLM